MSELYRVKQPGDVLLLPEDLPFADPEIPAGGYVLLSVSDTCCLSVLGENADGYLCATSHLVWVDLADLSLFVETRLAITPLE